MLLTILMSIMAIACLIVSSIAWKRSVGLSDKLQSLSDSVCFSCLAMVFAFFFYCLCIISPLELVTRKNRIIPETMNVEYVVPRWLWANQRPVVTTIIKDFFEQNVGDL